MSRKFTYEEVKDFIEVESNSGCKLLSNEYIDSRTKMLFECRCGNKFETFFSEFKQRNKRQCNKCGRKGAGSFTYNEVKNFIEIESHSECKLLSEDYNGTNANMLIQCKCGQNFTTTFTRFKHHNKRQCNQCSGWNRFNYEDIKRFIEVESGSGCKLLSKKYTRGDKLLDVQCKCGNHFSVRFFKFKSENKRQCNQCSGITNRNTDSFKQEVKDLTNNEYMVIGSYKNIDTHIKIKHNECGYEWDVIPDNFIHKGSRCPKCADRLRKDTSQFIKEVYNLVGTEYSVLEDYINGRTNINMKHNRCGYVWNIRPQNFLSGRRCPQCNESKGEQSIRLLMQDNDIYFETEYSFDDLFGEGGGLLRFDFAVFDSDNRLKVLIEYDGEFHFDKYYEEQNYETLQIHDKRKNQYCKENNIPLIRIPYWQFDKIEEILEKWLSKYGLIHKENIKEAV